MRTVQDARLLGNTNWYVVANKRGQNVVRREDQIKTSDTTIAGPYETKDQARCERIGAGQSDKCPRCGVVALNAESLKAGCLNCGYIGAGQKGGN